jgi:DNA repair protein RadA
MAKKKGSTDTDRKEEDSEGTSSYSLKDLPGVGDATLKKLKDAGILSIRTLAMYPLKKLTDEVGLGDKTAQKLVKTAQDVEKMGFKSADIIWHISFV